jgi:hypothetical protein
MTLSSAPGNHLNDETILLLTTGELEPGAADRAERHLSACAECRRTLGRAHLLRRELREALGRDGKATLNGRSHLHHRKNPLRWLAAAAGAVAIIWTATPRDLEARAILDRAILAEDRMASPPRWIRVSVGASSCSVGMSETVRTSADCGRLTNRLLGVPWDWRQPLTARAFRGWRERLADRSDSVVHRSSTVVVITTSKGGPIRSAQLVLVASDYRVTRALLTVENLPAIEISEESPGSKPAEIAGVEPVRGVGTPRELSQKPLTEDLANEMEVAGWLVLGRLKLLDGWKAAIERDGEDVHAVVMLESDGERTELLKALRPLRIDMPAVSLAGALESKTHWFPPSRESFGDSPGLGGFWIRKTLPPGMNATALTNEVLDISRRLLGQASILDALQTRKAALKKCSCSARLEPLIEEQRAQLTDSTARLVALLRPLFEPSAEAPPVLTGPAARRLDAALIHVFASSPQGPTLREEVAVIKSLLRLQAQL